MWLIPRAAVNSLTHVRVRGFIWTHRRRFIVEAELLLSRYGSQQLALLLFAPGGLAPRRVRVTGTWTLRRCSEFLSSCGDDDPDSERRQGLDRHWPH
jgi:hypothetical protein